MKTALSLFSVVLFLAAASQANAGTPTGATTVNQGVCDDLNAQDVTPALYGLCVAFCEALDCPDPSTSDNLVRQCRVASPAILARYNFLKTASDPGMPCVKPTCPCWTADELHQVGHSFSPHEMDLIRYADSTWMDDDLQEWFNTPSTSGWANASVGWISGDGGGNLCQYIDALIDWDAGGVWSGTARTQLITAEQAQVCKTELDAYVAELLSSGMSFLCYGNLCQ